MVPIFFSLLTLILVLIEIGRLLYCQHPLKEPVEAAVVFGSNEWKAKSRIEKAVELYKKGLVKKLMVCGAPIMTNKAREAPDLKIKMDFGIREAVWLKKQAIKLGISSKDILVEDNSTNYRENLYRGKKDY